MAVFFSPSVVCSPLRGNGLPVITNVCSLSVVSLRYDILFDCVFKYIIFTLIKLKINTSVSALQGEKDTAQKSTKYPEKAQK